MCKTYDVKSGTIGYDNEEGNYFRGRKGKIDTQEKWISYPVEAF